MSRKSLIICLAALAVMILGIGIAVVLLYSDTGDMQFRRKKVVPDEARYLLLPAVPADAVFVACLSDAAKSSYALPSGFPKVSANVAVSMHYNGDLQALYVFDAGKASAEPSEVADTLLSYAKAEGYYHEYVDCSETAGGDRDVQRRSLVVMSKSETLVKSSKRHLEKSISIMDASGFVEASAAVPGHDVMFFSNAHARTLMAGMFSREYAAHHPFVTSMSQWTVAEILKADGDGTYMNMSPVFANDPSEYMTVLSKSKPGTSEIARILPSYTISAVTLPLGEIEPYTAAYQAYMDSKQSLQSFRKKQRDLETKAGVSPDEFFRRLDVREVAKASFITGGKVEEINLMRIGREDPIIFAGIDSTTFRNYEPSIHSWPYDSFIPSVFGKYFEIEKNDSREKTCFTYIDGWVISGSFKAVEDYVTGKALSYSLSEYMGNAGQKDMLSPQSALTVYHSFTEYPEGRSAIFSKSFADFLKPFHEGGEYSPLVMTMTNSKGGLRMNMKLPKLSLSKMKAPEFVRDTTVIIPKGPFQVKNSGTGKQNLFYQNSNGAICLQEDGKDLWGVPFKEKLCGTAHNVDYYANGKLQIIFGAGSKIYIIDRLGRYVSGFPMDLGKEILLGPDVYDFNNKRAYNIMVLHKDNTIEMYNLKGKRPASWETIAAPETVKSLPERIRVGGNSFWVVRTAIQTLIYPFNGGSPKTSFEGNQMIKPDSGIEIIDGTSVKAECYDGKTRTIKLQ